MVTAALAAAAVASIAKRRARQYDDYLPRTRHCHICRAPWYLVPLVHSYELSLVTRTLRCMVGVVMVRRAALLTTTTRAPVRPPLTITAARAVTSVVSVVVVAVCVSVVVVCWRRYTAVTARLVAVVQRITCAVRRVTVRIPRIACVIVVARAIIGAWAAAAAPSRRR